MNHELWYTSAPRGLGLGTSGFCTVKATRSIPLQLKELLESLSCYRPVFPPNDPNASKNPVNFASVVVRIAGKKWQILSRVQAAGLDHTNRSNFFAHHIAVPFPVPKTTSPTAAVSSFASKWDFRAEELAQCRPLSAAPESLRQCRSWQVVTGDAGWAGVIAQRLENSERVNLVFSPGTALLPLVAEALALLPLDKQWTSTFSTYYCNVSQLADCQLRCVLTGSEEHLSAKALREFVLDLTGPLETVKGDGPLVTAARTGAVVTSDEPPVQVQASNRASLAPRVEEARGCSEILPEPA